MQGLQPYLPDSDPGAGPDGLPLDRAETKFTFTSQDALAAHFRQWLRIDLIETVIETEKAVFVVRKECSLEETRLQFLKKCEASLTRAISESEVRGGAGGWTGG